MFEDTVVMFIVPEQANTCYRVQCTLNRRLPGQASCYQQEHGLDPRLRFGMGLGLLVH